MWITILIALEVVLSGWGIIASLLESGGPVSSPFPRIRRDRKAEIGEMRVDARRMRLAEGRGVQGFRRSFAHGRGKVVADQAAPHERRKQFRTE
ncbi:MAG: hypothetical protein U1E30_04695 [Rhodoblastus sp.]